MKALIQRVSEAKVVVDGVIVGQIERGILAYIGIGHEDTLESAKKMVDKIISYRIFENTVDADKQGKLDWNVQQAAGGLLLVSQFTLMAKTNKGRRPDFGKAMHPEQAGKLFDELVEYTQSVYPKVATGKFGANMQVTAVNDGPLNFILQV